MVHAQYERWPYPSVSVFARVRARDAWQGQLDYILDRCGQSAPAAGRRPRIWVAGCGTFEAYPFAVANPNARLLATDWSRPSLRVARRRCWLQGVGSRVEFRALDLEDPDAYPDETFDLIICTGVLMNLNDPAAALRRLRSRLEPGGVLRMMVYPQYSRQRVFWIQRIARHLGLDSSDRRAPRQLRKLLQQGLPRAHPLRRTFETYRDSKTDAGIVDAFLHAGDRGFTGRELGNLIHDAGLRAASFEHRPWGQPSTQAGRLGLPSDRPFEVLHDLDLWQELRTNFIVSCVRQEASITREEESPAVLRPHPAFTFAGRGNLRGRAELLAESLLGVRVASRIHDEPSVRVSGRAIRALSKILAMPRPSPAAIAELEGTGLCLGRQDPVDDRLGPPLPASEPAHAPWIPGWANHDGLSPNPLYGHLFAAWGDTRRCADESLQEGIDRRGSPILPLEDETCPFGLTPEGSAHAVDEAAAAWIEELADAAWLDDREAGALTVLDHGGGEERDLVGELRPVLASVPGLPASEDLPPGALRDCWAALVGWRSLRVPVAATPAPRNAPELAARTS